MTVLSGCLAQETELVVEAESDEMVITFEQTFNIAELCFDEDGEGSGWVAGCGRDVSVHLIVEDGLLLDGSEMIMSGSESLIIDEVAYGEGLTASAPLEGELKPYGSPYGPCFAGQPHHPNDDVSIWLITWGGFNQDWINVAVRFGGIEEAYAPLLAEDPLHDAFALDPTEECTPRRD